MDDAANARLLAAWLESLSYGDVLARMNKFQFTSNYDPDIVLRNLDVFEDTLDNARHFADGSAQ